MIVLTIESKLVCLFYPCGPIPSIDMSFWCPLLDLHLTTFHSNIGVIFRLVSKLCPLILSKTKALFFGN